MRLILLLLCFTSLGLQCEKCVVGTLLYKFELVENDSAFWLQDVDLIIQKDTFSFGGFNFDNEPDNNQTVFIKQVDWEDNLVGVEDSSYYCLKGGNAYINADSTLFYWGCQLKIIPQFVKIIPAKYQGFSSNCPIDFSYEDTMMVYVNKFVRVKQLPEKLKKELGLKTVDYFIKVNSCY